MQNKAEAARIRRGEKECDEREEAKEPVTGDL